MKEKDKEKRVRERSEKCYKEKNRTRKENGGKKETSKNIIEHRR